MAGSAPTCAACGAELPRDPRLSGRDRLHGIPGGFDVLVCGRCGSGRTRPHVPTGELGALYPRDYNAHSLPDAPAPRAAATALYRWRYFRALRRVPLRALAEREPGRLLDVGGGRGDLGVVMGARGWEVTGLEPSEEACHDARDRGVRMVAGTLSAAPPELGDGYDAAAFQHSLEHVAEPADDLRTVRGLLRPGGLLAISLPNFGSSQARRFGTDWFHLDLPRHRTHFTPDGLRILLERSGFDVEAVTTSSSADGLPMSLRYRRGRDGADGGYASTAAVLALSPAGVLLDRATGGGDLLHALATRPL